MKGDKKDKKKKKDNGKTERILTLYEKLCDGKMVNQKEEQQNFRVCYRSILRDIEDINAFLFNRKITYGDNRYIEKDKKSKNFLLRGIEDSVMTNSEILAVSKILLESRAFTKQKMKNILHKLVQSCASKIDVKLVSNLIENEQHYYTELNCQPSIDKLWEIGTHIKEQNLIEITYTKADFNKTVVIRIIEPVAILFQEYYFYLNAFMVKKDERGNYKHIFDEPTIFRIDKISELKSIGEKYRVVYSEKFQEGDFRNKVQFMYTGKIVKIRFKFFGSNIDAVFDRLNGARIISQSDKECLIEAEAYERGLKMWLFSQGENIEVISPESFRNSMKTSLEKTLSRYQ